MEQDEARDLFGRAEKSLEAAEVLVSVDPNSSASRAYYAAFQAVSALLGLEGAEFRKHSQIVAAVHRDLVKTGRWTTALGQDFSSLRTQRDVGDYSSRRRVSTEGAAEAVAAARRILAAARGERPDVFGESPSE